LVDAQLVSQPEPGEVVPQFDAIGNRGGKGKGKQSGAASLVPLQSSEKEAGSLEGSSQGAWDGIAHHPTA
jgi:hypothetical protein